MEFQIFTLLNDPIHIYLFTSLHVKIKPEGIQWTLMLKVRVYVWNVHWRSWHLQKRWGQYIFRLLDRQFFHKFKVKKIGKFQRAVVQNKLSSREYKCYSIKCHRENFEIFLGKRFICKIILSLRDATNSYARVLCLRIKNMLNVHWRSRHLQKCWGFMHIYGFFSLAWSLH